MKKVFLALAFIATLAVTSCKQANEEIGKIDAPADSTAVQVDSVKVDTVAVDTTKVADTVK
jgi:outer membrane lipoprotein SlyB